MREYKFRNFSNLRYECLKVFLGCVCWGYAWPGFLSHEQSHITSAGDDELRA